MKLSVQSFSGISPKTNPRYLPDGGSQVALNVEAFGQSLKPLKGLGAPLSASIVAGAKTIYRADMGGTPPNQYWFSSTREANVCRGQIAGDSQEWTFFTTDEYPSATYRELAIAGGAVKNPLPTVRLGVAPPDGALAGSVTYVEPINTGASIILTEGIIAQMTTWNYDSKRCDVQLSIDKGVNWFMPTTIGTTPNATYTITAAELAAMIPSAGIGISVDGLRTAAAWGEPASNSQADVITCINTAILRSGQAVAQAVAQGADVKVTATVAGGPATLVIYWITAAGRIQHEVPGTPLSMTLVQNSLSGTLVHVDHPGYTVTGTDYYTITWSDNPQKLTLTTKPYCTLNGNAHNSYTTRAACETAGGIWTDNGAKSSLLLKYGPSSTQILGGQGTTEDKGVYESRVYAFTWTRTFTYADGGTYVWESAPSPASEVANVYSDSTVNVVRRYSGVCSVAAKDGTAIHDKRTCETNKGTWTPYDSVGTCSIPAHTNEGACRMAGGTWTVTSGKALPPVIMPPVGWDVTGIRLYRSVAGVYLFVTEGLVSASDIHSATNNVYFSDTYKSDQLGEPCPSISWTPPPTHTSDGTTTHLHDIINLPNGIIAGFLDRDVAFCEPYRPYAWPEEYQQTIDYPIVGLGAIDTTLAVLTTGSPYFIQGAHPATMTVVKSDLQQSCVSRRSIVSMTNTVLYASPDGLIALTPGGSAIVTDSIFRRQDWQALSPSSIHAYGHDDKYIAFHTPVTLDGVLYTGFIIDMRTKQFIRHNLANITCGYADLITDTLYLCNGNTLQAWEGSANAMPGAKWRSKKFTTPQVTAFTCAQVESEGATGMKVRFYRDGVKLATNLTDDLLTTANLSRIDSRDPIRLEAKKGRDWEIELDVTQEVFNVLIAQAPSELATA